KSRVLAPRSQHAQRHDRTRFASLLAVHWPRAGGRTGLAGQGGVSAPELLGNALQPRLRGPARLRLHALAITRPSCQVGGGLGASFAGRSALSVECPLARGWAQSG